MDFVDVVRTGATFPRDQIIELMRDFTLACFRQACAHAALSGGETNKLVSRGTLDGPGRYKQSNYDQVSGVTPFFKQFKPTSEIFDRAMLGSEPTGGNDWLAGVRINTKAAGDGQYRVTAIAFGLIRWGNAGTEIQERMVNAAAAAWANMGRTLAQLDRSQVGDHLWGICWAPHQLDAATSDDLSRTIGSMMAALLEPLRERREWTAPRMVLFPRFDSVTVKTAEAAGSEPTTGAYQFTFRMHEGRALPSAERTLPAVANGQPVTFQLGGAASGVRYITSCEGSSIREVGRSLGMRHGDHARFSLQPDGRWLVERADPPGILIKLGNLQAGGKVLTGAATLAALAVQLRDHGDVWFGVRNPTAIRESRLQEYRSAIERGLPVWVYFSVGSSAGGTGDVWYVAKLATVESGAVELEAPGPYVVPALRALGACRVWLRLTEFQVGGDSVPLNEFILEDSGKPVDRALRSPMVYVYRVGSAGNGLTAPQAPLELVGCSGNIDSYFDEMQAFIEQHGACMYFWTFGIRHNYRERLEQGPFWLNICKAGGDQTIRHRCLVERLYTTDTPGIESPEPSYTLVHEIGKQQIDGLTARSWFKVTAFEELLEPIPLTAFVDYESGDLIVPQALINAFAYVRRGAHGLPETTGGAITMADDLQVRTLDEILEAFVASDLIYARGDLINLHHALHALPTKHFVILHGVSGTGKSQFAQAYANALYGRQPLTEPGNPYYRIVSVQPTWQDRTALLGYYNPLTEVYDVPSFLSHVLEAAGDPQHLYVICLDEMNLAVVEHYFADFLSAWESREPIPLHHHAGQVTAVPEVLTVPENLLVIGTVNVDETTHAFSPKVLDRAYTVELSHVDVTHFGEQFLDRSEAAPHRDSLAPAVALLGAVNHTLEPHGLHFAYRTMSEILSFLLANARATQQLGEAAALDLMLCQKVLPKLRGDDRMLPMLRDLDRLVRDRLGEGSFRSPRVLERLIADADRFGTFQFWR